MDLGGTGQDYANKIDTLYKDGGDTVPSIVAADNDVVLSFLEKDYYVPVKNIGITSADYANAYQYTIDYATVDNELMALTWQATPGAVAYRTDIAQKVLGVSDPKSVQAQMSDWDKFFATADKLKKAGYYIVSGPDEIKYAMLDSRQSPWVVNGALNIDPAVSDYLAYSKKLYDGGYTKNATMWSAEWTANMAEGVFCYFGCTWFIPWSLYIEDTPAFGKYNVIEGPTSYHWGGSYLMVTDKCPNKELARLLLYTLCCDTETMYDIFAMDTDFPNNQKAVEQLIADGKGNLAKLGGQDPLPVYHANAKKLRLQNALPNDNIYNAYLDTSLYKIEEVWGDDGKSYYGYKVVGHNTVDEAIALFKEQVSVGFPNVKIPN